MAVFLADGLDIIPSLASSGVPDASPQILLISQGSALTEIKRSQVSASPAPACLILSGDDLDQRSDRYAVAY